MCYTKRRIYFKCFKRIVDRKKVLIEYLVGS